MEIGVYKTNFEIELLEFLVWQHLNLSVNGVITTAIVLYLKQLFLPFPKSDGKSCTTSTYLLLARCFMLADIYYIA